MLPRARRPARARAPRLPRRAPCIGSSCCRSRCTSALGSRAAHRADRRRRSQRRPAAAARVAGHGAGRAVRVLVTGATGFTGGHLARALAARGDEVRALVRDAAASRRSRRAPASSSCAAICADRDLAGAPRSTASRSSTTSPRCTGRPACREATYRARERRSGWASSSRRRPRPACGASCTAAPSACTATSSIRPPTRTRRSGPATSIRRRSSKASGSRARRRRARGIELTIARPSGHLRPGRSPAAEAVSRRRAAPIRRARRRAKSSTI